MSLPTRFGVGQPSWYTNPTMPNYEDYASDPTGYEAAVKAWVQSQNGTTPMFQPSQSIAGPNGESGWRMAGNDNTALNTLTPGEYQAQLLNHRMQQAGMHPGSPNAKMMELAMYSHNQVRPEDYAGAYNAAMTSTGGPLPVLNDAALKFLEDTLGYGPPKKDATKTDPGKSISGTPLPPPIDPVRINPTPPSPVAPPIDPTRKNTGPLSEQDKWARNVADYTLKPVPLPHLGGPGQYVSDLQNQVPNLPQPPPYQPPVDPGNVMVPPPMTPPWMRPGPQYGGY